MPVRSLAPLGLLALCLGACVTLPGDLADPGVDAETRTDAAPDGQEPPDGGLCEGLPAEGRCQGNRLFTCDLQGIPAERDCAAEGKACLAGDGVPPRCGALPTTCADLRTGSLCAGDRLVLCHGGWLHQAPCDSLGGRCDAQGVRPGCAPRPGGAARVTGQITRDHREALPEGLGPLSAAPAAGLTVTLLDARDRRPLALGTTDTEGRFVLLYDPSVGLTEVILRVLTLAVDPDHRLWVTDGEEAAYAVESAPLSSGEEAASLHLPEAAGAGAFHIFEVLGGLQGAAASRVDPDLPPLQVTWEAGARLGCGTCFSRYPPSLLVSGEAADPDEFDPSVLGHEFGHYLLWVTSRDDSPGGEHDGSPTDPRLAWSEGAATWVGLTLLGRDLYVDTTATGATVRDPEDLGVTADPLGGLDQYLSEHLVLQLLWDLTDPSSGPLDPLFHDPSQLFDVLTAYLPSPDLADRGHLGVELVEFLDGWICRGHGERAGLEALVDGIGFPYDFGGPLPPCPKPRSPIALDLALEGHAGAIRATLWVKSPRRVAVATAHLRAPKPWGTPWEDRRELDPLEAGVATPIRWILPPGLDPPWVAAGVGSAEGARGEEHTTVVTWRRKAPRRRHRIFELGGLLRLRVPER